MPVDCQKFQIITERLRLRCFRKEDVDILFKWWSDIDIMKYTPEGIYSYDTISDIIHRIVENYKSVSADNFYAFSLLIEHKDNADKIGWCGIIRMFPFPQNIEIFVGLDKLYWGQSYAEEATRALLGFVYNFFGFRTITALVHPENIPSIKILEKIGFSFVRHLDNCPEPYQNHNGFLLFSIKLEKPK